MQTLFRSAVQTSFKLGNAGLKTGPAAGRANFRITSPLSSIRTMSDGPSSKKMKGQQVPNVTLKARKDGDWLDINTGDYFKGKKVVVFSLPGAFTPTCSTSHLPRYEQLVPAFKKLGVDKVACVSVNDGFVMEAWGKDQKVTGVDLLPDGNGEFTKGMGMLVGKEAVGFGPRSWRYSMFVNDGKVEHLFSEPEKEGDPYEVSDADTMLKALDANFEIPPSALLFTKVGCPFCAKAKTLLKSKDIAFEEVIVGEQVSSSALRAVANAATVPQVFIDGKLIGGSDDLEKHLA